MRTDFRRLVPAIQNLVSCNLYPLAPNDYLHYGSQLNDAIFSSPLSYDLRLWNVNKEKVKDLMVQKFCVKDKYIHRVSLVKRLAYWQEKKKQQPVVKNTAIDEESVAALKSGKKVNYRTSSIVRSPQYQGRRGGQSRFKRTFSPD